MKKIYLRPANALDSDFLLDLRNDEQTRKNSFNIDEISQKEHEIWLENTLKNEKIKLFILMLDEQKIGQIRLEKLENHYNLSYAILKEFRGKGYGLAVILLAQNELAQNSALKALVKPENIASQKIFTKLEFNASKENDKIIFTKNSRIYSLDEIQKHIKF